MHSKKCTAIDDIELNFCSFFILHRELSLKEAIAMKQQGESTSTVERIKSLQNEIHELKYVALVKFCFADGRDNNTHH